MKNISLTDVTAIYGSMGVDVENALAILQNTPISLHCWQGDDVGGFENPDGELGSGLAVTGNYPGKARNIDELRQDLDKALSLIPGKHRLNLHAIYGDFSQGKVDRDAIDYAPFSGWVDWCAEREMGFDFNPTCFSHPKADDGLTLSHPDKEIRDFWIRHCQACRRVAAEAGEKLKNPVVTNIWIPDGMKDLPADRSTYRSRLKESLDEIFAEKVSSEYNLDAVESKLFGIGSESFVVGSHEFYLGYAAQNNKTLCLDAGHFHPTESIADKISSVLLYVPRLLLHVSRGVRWDSDHVVLMDDPTVSIMQELVRSQALDRTHIGLDFFDASINRIAAWTIGTRAAQKALLFALLEPRELLLAAEKNQDYTERLALMEAAKTLPFGRVWDEFCQRNDTPSDRDWLSEVKTYEEQVLVMRATS